MKTIMVTLRRFLRALLSAPVNLRFGLGISEDFRNAILPREHPCFYSNLTRGSTTAYSKSDTRFPISTSPATMKFKATSVG